MRRSDVEPYRGIVWETASALLHAQGDEYRAQVAVLWDLEDMLGAEIIDYLLGFSDANDFFSDECDSWWDDWGTESEDEDSDGYDSYDSEESEDGEIDEAEATMSLMLHLLDLEYERLTEADRMETVIQWLSNVPEYDDLIMQDQGFMNL